jgi:phage terminase large subunit GpA-like protein
VWPDYLPDEFFSEMTSERRTPKGWEKVSSRSRNESWDLAVYAIALCVHLGVERIDWQKPPSWAAEWDKNSLVRKPEAKKPFTERGDVKQRMSTFGATLG